MKVPYSYLAEQFSDANEIFRDIKELLKECQFTLGEELSSFEKKFAFLTGSKFAAGVGSGTDAIFLSLKCLGIGTGDEVITCPMTFVATAGAIAASGAKPVFVDSGPDFNIDPARIEKAITSKTRAIIPVHYTGCPADMPSIMTIASKHNIPIIEDACQAIGAAYDNQPVGTFGISGAFSLHPLKNLNVWGDGGVIITNSEKTYQKILLLRNHGLKNRDEADIFGYNSRLDTIQAIVGNHLIESVNDITEKRINNAKLYDGPLGKLKEFISIPPRDPRARHVYHLYMFYAKERDKLLKHLLSHGIEAKIHYPIPMHLQKAAKKLGYKDGDFPVCEKQCRSIISLPVHQHLSTAQIKYVIDTIRSFYLKADHRVIA